jgi:hypothetical protein
MQALSLPGESAPGEQLESFWKGMARVAAALEPNVASAQYEQARLRFRCNMTAILNG